jgi:hypothetical protein
MRLKIAFVVAIIGLATGIIALTTEVIKLINALPTPTAIALATNTLTPTRIFPTESPVPQQTPTFRLAQPTATILARTPTPVKLSISSLNRLALLTLFQIPRKTRITVDRLDAIFRPNRASSLVIIPNYPLLC